MLTPRPRFRPSALLAALLLVAGLAAGCIPETEDVGDAGPGDDTNVADTGADTLADTGGGPDALTPDATSPDATGPDATGDTGTPPEKRPVTEEGPYEVGFRTMTVRHQAEADGTDDKRELKLAVWYPRASPPEGEVLVPARYIGIMRRDEVASKAPLAAGESFPLLVFSHGNGGMAEQSFFMTEFWASHGWIVVSPDHTGNTFRSGTSINYEAAIYRPQDITAVLDHILNLPEDDPFHGKISDDIVMSGHSFGAVTTLMNAGTGYDLQGLKNACDSGMVDRQGFCDVFTRDALVDLLNEGLGDPRIKVGIPQAPGGAAVFRDELEQIDIPIMMMTGGMDATLSNEDEGDPLWNYIKDDDEPHRRLNFPKAGHFTFSNMCDFFGSVEQVKNDGCADRFIEPKVAYDIINTYSLAYARWHLWGDEEAREIIDGERFPHAEMHIELSAAQGSQ